jgi:hypothetical protein
LYGKVAGSSQGSQEAEEEQGKIAVKDKQRGRRSSERLRRENL